MLAVSALIWRHEAATNVVLQVRSGRVRSGQVRFISQVCGFDYDYDYYDYDYDYYCYCYCHCYCCYCSLPCQYKQISMFRMALCHASTSSFRLPSPGKTRAHPDLARDPPQKTLELQLLQLTQSTPAPAVRWQSW